MNEQGFLLPIRMSTHLVGELSSSHIFTHSLSSSAHCKSKQLSVGLKEYKSLASSAKRESYMGSLIIFGKSLI